MNTYITLVRGINVSGQKMIKMPALVNLYESIGFKNVSTYIQSGNLLFKSSISSPDKIAEKIEKNIKSTFGFEVKVIIRTPEELKMVINKNPFLKRDRIDTIRLYVSFLSNEPDKKLIKDLQINKNESEEFQIIGKEIYLYLPQGFGNAKLQAGVFEKKLNVSATARNWKTVNALYEMAKEK